MAGAQDLSDKSFLPPLRLALGVVVNPPALERAPVSACPWGVAVNPPALERDPVVRIYIYISIYMYIFSYIYLYFNIFIDLETTCPYCI